MEWEECVLPLHIVGQVPPTTMLRLLIGEQQQHTQCKTCFIVEGAEAEGCTCGACVFK